MGLERYFSFKLDLKFHYFHHKYSFPSCFAFITKTFLIYFLSALYNIQNITNFEINWDEWRVVK